MDDRSMPPGLAELVGVQIVWFEDWYDGPLDGLATVNGREFWFAAVDDELGVPPELSHSRRYVLHEITPEQVEALWDEHRRLSAFARGEGDSKEWGRAWEERADYSDAPAMGWFRE